MAVRTPHEIILIQETGLALAAQFQECDVTIADPQ
jgi:hypothetical protein